MAVRYDCPLSGKIAALQVLTGIKQLCPHCGRIVSSFSPPDTVAVYDESGSYGGRYGIRWEQRGWLPSRYCPHTIPDNERNQELRDTVLRDAIMERLNGKRSWM